MVLEKRQVLHGNIGEAIKTIRLMNTGELTTGKNEDRGETPHVFAKGRWEEIERISNQDILLAIKTSGLTLANEQIFLQDIREKLKTSKSELEDSRRKEVLLFVKTGEKDEFIPLSLRKMDRSRGDKRYLLCMKPTLNGIQSNGQEDPFDILLNVLKDGFNGNPSGTANGILFTSKRRAGLPHHSDNSQTEGDQYSIEMYTKVKTPRGNSELDVHPEGAEVFIEHVEPRNIRSVHIEINPDAERKQREEYYKEKFQGFDLQVKLRQRNKTFRLQ